MISRAIGNLKSKIQNFTWGPFSRSQAEGGGRLVRQYFLVFVILIGGGLIASGLLEIYFRYYETQAQVALIQGEVAQTVVSKIAQSILEIEGQMKAVSLSQEIAVKGFGSEYKFELMKLLNVAPAITDVVAIDVQGAPRVHVARFRAILSDEEPDYSKAASFLQVKQGITFFGPVYFVRGSEPYMTMAVPIERFPGSVIGVLQAEVNLRYIWEIVRDINVGKAGYAYIVSRSGDIIAHPDIGLVLQRRKAAHLDQVKAALRPAPAIQKPESTVALSLSGEKVLSSYAFLPSLDWAVIIERPLEEAYEPLYASVSRTSTLLLIGLGIALFASVFVARRVVRPLRALREGVERIGRGDLSYRLDLKTGDEIEVLAEEFNKMTRQLQESYGSLEQKVEERTNALQMRTQELTRTVKELKALGEVSQAVSSTLDIETVLTGIVSHAVQLSGTDGGIIYEYDEATERLHLRASHRTEQELVEALRANPIDLGVGTVGRAAASRMPVQITDLLDEPEYAGTRLRPMLRRLGYRSLLAVPLLREDRIMGGLSVYRRKAGSFSTEIVNLVQTFATQSVIAIHNARLYREIQEKGREIELTSKYKSQFLANMSHELRTPLNAVLGYTRMLLTKVYGDVPEKIGDVLERIEKSGRHLLGLINDVLDLSKIEAGQVTLSLNAYSMKEVVQNVVTAMQPLAAEKKLALKVSLPTEVPPAYGDERRITQVLLNLVGNAIKFTDGGEVRVQAIVANGALVVSVSDTGPGISERDQQKIFEEFRQVENSATAKKGGTGLGLAIAKRIIELHEGRIWVESSLGKGSTFSFMLPVRVEQQARMA
jgi:signal transduction histidine kinase